MLESERRHTRLPLPPRKLWEQSKDNSHSVCSLSLGEVCTHICALTEPTSTCKADHLLSCRLEAQPSADTSAYTALKSFCTSFPFLQRLLPLRHPSPPLPRAPHPRLPRLHSTAMTCLSLHLQLPENGDCALVTFIV